jgi:hypothetical protein
LSHDFHESRQVLSELLVGGARIFRHASRHTTGGSCMLLEAQCCLKHCAAEA